MKKYIKIDFIILILAIIMIVFSTIAFATNVSTENESNLETLETQKADLEANLETTSKAIEIVEAELSHLLVEIEEISLDIIEKNQEVDRLTLENNTLEVHIKDVQAQLDKVSSDYVQKKKILDQRLIVAYENGRTSYLDVLLRSKDIIGFISNYYLVTEIVQADQELIKDITSKKESIDQLNKVLLEKSAKLQENIENIKKNKIALENMQVLKTARVEELSETEKNVYLQLEEYQTKMEEVEREIRFLNLSNISAEYLGGVMAWPIPGYTRITSDYGMRTHPITGIYKLHTGIDVGAPVGASFIAANDGTVVKAEQNVAYGNMVIIDHGGGVTTLYAHGSEILVKVGDVVKQGTPVLKVGTTGYSTGPHAHFEVRVNGEYKNPLDYVTSLNTGNTNDKTEKQEVVVNQ